MPGPSVVKAPGAPPLQHAGVLDPASALHLAGILGVAPPETRLPPMWHTTHLLDRWARADLGPDGHAMRGLPTPPTEPHRRMFAGGRAIHHHPLRMGEPASRTSFVRSSAIKSGRSGELTFVTVCHQYQQAGRVAVVDEQDIVYQRADGIGGAAVKLGQGEVEAVDDETRFEVDPVTLFMFSSATANAHRIHYDLDFARSEGHPELVVHGPLQVLLMAGALSAQGEDFTGREFAYRLLSPARGSQVLRIGSPKAKDAGVVVLDAAGRRVAQAVLAP